VIDAAKQAHAVDRLIERLIVAGSGFPAFQFKVGIFAQSAGG
jgi:hypothetical protein